MKNGLLRGRQRTAPAAKKAVVWVLLCLGLVLCGGSCGKKGDGAKEYAVLGEYVDAQAPFSKVTYTGGQVSVNDRCAVDREKLDLRVPPVYVNGRPVGLCSVRCANMFMKGPEKYLRSLNIAVKCAVDPNTDAVLSAGSRAFVNYEVYYFSSPTGLREFIKEPYKYTGEITDPVSTERFQPSEASPRRNRGGRAFYFSSQQNARAFDNKPTEFDPPIVEMKETR